MLTKTQIYPHEWIQLSQETRASLAQVFGIKKTGGVVVVDNQLQSDGYMVNDLAALSLAKLQEFTNSTEEDYVKILNMAIDKINKINGMLVASVEPTPEPEIETLPEVKIEKPNAKKTRGK